MAGIDFGALRFEVGMATVLDLLGFVPWQRRGDQLRGPCPVHRSHSPKSRSFSVNLARNACRCFHCGLSGNQLDLWAVATRQPLYQAAIDLCEKLHRPVPRLGRRPGDRKNFTIPS
jgi:DNA primase